MVVDDGMQIDPIERLFEDRLIVVVGNYGSGKTEVSVNLAFRARAQGRRVVIADLDVVNPYFRCREQLEAMEAAGIETVVPGGDKRWADQPIVLPSIKGMAQAGADGGVRIFDVGGDDVGATLLSSLFEAMHDRPYELLQVVNTKRPFTDSSAGILAMKDALERKSRLTVTGFIANAHLMDDTTAAVIVEGIEAAKAAAETAGIQTVFAAVMSPWNEDSAVRNTGVPLLVMERRMLPPWKSESHVEAQGFGPPGGRAVRFM